MAAYNCVNCMVYICGSANYASLFAQMFPDSEIALRFQVQKDENPYAVIYGLGSFSKTAEFYCSEVSLFTILFDKSLNKVLQSTQMEIVVSLVRGFLLNLVLK